MSILLTSNGLSSAAIIEAFTQVYIAGFTKAAIIVTADPEYRENDWQAEQTKFEFEKIGFHSSYFDIEFVPPYQLLDFDLLFFIGGNPYYLLNQIRKTNTDRILRELITQGKVISGASAGSIVLGESIALINEFEPQMNNIVGLTDLAGVGLTNVNLCPHYSRFLEQYERFEERVGLVEKTHNIKVTRINDGEGVMIDGTIVNKLLSIT